MTDNHSLRSVLVDLDRTLYPPATGLQEAGDRLINEWMTESLGLSSLEVDLLRRQLRDQYGTTARGLEEKYGIPQSKTYEQSIERLRPADYVWPRPQVRKILLSVGLPVYVFTNSTRPYCEQVLEALGLEDCFAGLVTIETMGWQAKPQKEAYQAALKVAGTEPQQTLFLDDSVANLEAAARMGLPAVLCHPRPKPHWAPCISDILRLPELLAVLTPEN
ncbi:MAG: HAD-IA family hydrolase [candidate division WS1 bacterium]|nr:HAD-IA family hydrolase [candidate division WS1 bacterium]